MGTAASKDKTNGKGDAPAPKDAIERKPTTYVILIKDSDGKLIVQGVEEASNQQAAKRQALSRPELSEAVASPDGVTLAAVPSASLQFSTAKVERTTKLVLS